MKELEKQIKNLFSVDNEELTQIASLFKPMDLKKGNFFLKADGYSNKLGFVEQGILREFVYLDGKDVTKWISTEGYFVVDLASFLFHQKARWNIQALTDCELYVIDIKDYQKIGKLIPKWIELEKMFIAKCFTILEDRIFQLIAFSAEERYSNFFSMNKELFNRVPLQYIASMLGMTPETLSRLRKKAAG